jgi:hypothetical protein
MTKNRSTSKGKAGVVSRLASRSKPSKSAEDMIPFEEASDFKDF